MQKFRGFYFSLWIIATVISYSLFGQSANPLTVLPADGCLYVHASLGKDTNSGSRDNPLRSLNEAARRVNASEGVGAVTIYLAAGTYGLSETVEIRPSRHKLSQSERLTIRAEQLPDDAAWMPSSMPVIISTMPFSEERDKEGKITGGQNFGILIDASHVTLQGLRILGEPVHEQPASGVLVRNYPVVWEGKDLEDLHITQCLFLGSRYAVPNHLAVLSNGRGLEVDHCVFFGVKDAVVMWNSSATNASMHHNLILDTYGGIVWTWSAAEDFRFYNNVISNANVIWILNKDEKLSYVMNHTVIVGYHSLVNKGGGPQGFGEKASPGKLKLNDGVILRKKGKLEVIEDQTNRHFLHIKPGTLGYDLGAGLFNR